VIWTRPWWLSAGEPKEARDDWLGLAFTPCRFGNSRPWFLCPKCSTRRAKLYVDHGEIECRRCLRLVYASQWEGPRDRAARRARKIRRRLGAPEGIILPMIRPPGMHRRTFEQLEHEATDAMWVCLRGYADSADRLERTVRRMEERLAANQARREP